jgi:hypothetical protein
VMAPSYSPYFLPLQEINRFERATINAYLNNNYP